MNSLLYGQTLIIQLLIVLFLSSCQKEEVLVDNPSWERLPDPPFPEKIKGASLLFGIKDDVFVYIGPTNAIESSDTWNYVYKFDVLDKKWTQLRDFSELAHRNPVFGFAIDHRGYFCDRPISGSTGEGNERYEIWEYAPEIDSWKQLSNSPAESTFDCIGIINSRAYLYGGIYRDIDGLDPYVSQEFWEYDPTRDLWTKKSNTSSDYFPNNGRGRAAAFGFVIDDLFYVGGGIDRFIKSEHTIDYRYEDFWSYDAAINTWHKKGSIPAHSIMGISGAIDGAGYVGLGYSSILGEGEVPIGRLTKPVKRMYRFHPLEGWSEIDPFPGSSNRGGSYILHMDKIHFLAEEGPEEGVNTTNNEFWVLKNEH